MSRDPGPAQRSHRTSTRDPAFVPANHVEVELLDAAEVGKTDTYLSTLLLAKVLLPIPAGASETVTLSDPGFEWRRELIDGQPYVVVFTSRERMVDHLGESPAVTVKFVQLIKMWPDESWSFAVNPNTPVGATLPGSQIKALASWAADVGLTDEEPDVQGEAAAAVAAIVAEQGATRAAVLMQKAMPPSHVPYYLERGYDRVSGFVNRAAEVEHLRTPEQMYLALGLCYTGSPFKPSDDEVYVLRWPAYCEGLYRIPYGGQHEAGMRAMQGWVIERRPFRGNGFAPSETNDVIAEFKVDSARLPHGAQMWHITRDGGATLVAVLDADGPIWTPADTPPGSVEA